MNLLNVRIQITEFDEYLTLQRNKLIEIISDDNLNVLNEEIVYTAVIRWLKHSEEERLKNFYEVNKILFKILKNNYVPFFLVLF